MPLLVCLPIPVYSLYLLTYWPRPRRQTKNRRLFSSERVPKTIFMPCRRCMDCTRANMLMKAGIGFFANLLYPNRMPLYFFTASSPNESMTLSPVTLVQYYPDKIPIFDAKPLISESVTLSLLCFSSANHQLSPSRRRILNVTASNISLSVK